MPRPAGRHRCFPRSPSRKQPAGPPQALPTDIRPLAPETALAVNAQIPITGAPGSAAAPFSLGKASAETRARALECLTSAIYYEAGQESADGQRAVAQVVLNRVRHPAFPNSVCGVVYEGSTRVTGCQFTFTCDGSMTRGPVPALWNRARQVAGEMLKGRVYAPVGHATHYHANYVVPYWASSLVKTSVEGAHIFYRWAGGWGRPAAFSSRWSGREGNPAALRLAALSAPHVAPPVKTAAATVEKLEDAGAKVHRGQEWPGADAVHAPGARSGREGEGHALCRARRRVRQSQVRPAGRQSREQATPFWAQLRGGGTGSGPIDAPTLGGLGRFIKEKMARVTGLEPATSGVTGRRSNQLSYTRVLGRAAN